MRVYQTPSTIEIVGRESGTGTSSSDFALRRKREDPVLPMVVIRICATRESTVPIQRTFIPPDWLDFRRMRDAGSGLALMGGLLFG
jgi:hypothetical protein